MSNSCTHPCCSCIDRVLLGRQCIERSSLCLQLGVSEEVDARVRLLRERVTLESKLQADLAQLQGTLQPILAAALAQQPELEQ